MSAEQLILHFKSTLKFKWYHNVNYSTKNLFDFWNKNYDLKLDHTSKEIQLAHVIIQGIKRRIVCFHIDNINENFEKLKEIIYETKRNDIKVKNDNIGKNKWYSKIYQKFKQYLKDENWKFKYEEETLSKKIEREQKLNNSEKTKTEYDNWIKSMIYSKFAKFVK